MSCARKSPQARPTKHQNISYDSQTSWASMRCANWRSLNDGIARRQEECKDCKWLHTADFHCLLSQNLTHKQGRALELVKIFRHCVKSSNKSIVTSRGTKKSRRTGVEQNYLYQSEMAHGNSRHALGVFCSDHLVAPSMRNL